MNSFDKEINQFMLDGTFTNNLDDAGNINLFTDPINVNQKYISFSLENWIYKNDQIESLYDVNITEFTIPQVTSSIVSVEDVNITKLSQENILLKEQLNAAVDAASQNSASAIIDASKDIILKLRMQLNEGKTESDFSDNFPYLKK